MPQVKLLRFLTLSLFALVCAGPLSLMAATPPSGDPPPKPTPPPPPSDAKAVLPVTPALIQAKPDPSLEAAIDKDPVKNPEAKTNMPVTVAPTPTVKPPEVPDPKAVKVDVPVAPHAAPPATDVKKVEPEKKEENKTEEKKVE